MTQREQAKTLNIKALVLVLAPVALAATLGILYLRNNSGPTKDPSSNKRDSGPGLDEVTGPQTQWQRRSTANTNDVKKGDNNPEDSKEPELHHRPPAPFSIAGVRERAGVKGDCYGIRCLMPQRGLPEGGVPILTVSLGETSQTWVVTLGPLGLNDPKPLDVKALGHAPIGSPIPDETVEPVRVLKAIWQRYTGARVLALECVRRSRVTVRVEPKTGALVERDLAEPVALYEAWIALNDGTTLFEYFHPNGQRWIAE